MSLWQADGRVRARPRVGGLSTMCGWMMPPSSRPTSSGSSQPPQSPRGPFGRHIGSGLDCRISDLHVGAGRRAREQAQTDGAHPDLAASWRSPV